MYGLGLGTICVPRTGALMNPIDVLLPQVRRDLLTLLFLHPGESFHLREIARRLKTGHGVLQREVPRLVDAGVLVATQIGRRVQVRANTEGFLFEAIRSLLEKTVGPTGRIREVLMPLVGEIRVAFLYGSVPAGTARESSDVDLMVIGEVTFDAVAGVLPPAEELLEREINPSILPVAEFRERRARGDVFLETVLAGPRFFVVGEAHVLEELG